MQTKVVVNIKTHILGAIKFFNNHAIYRIMWKIIIQPGRSQMTAGHQRFSRCIPISTKTYSQYAIIIAFPLQQWLHERASMLRYTYIACIVEFNLKIIVKNKYLNYVIFYLKTDNVNYICSQFNNHWILFVQK